ncbi:MAG: hypothetical protein ACI4RH_00730 [Huintestinicola sp.]
MAYCINCGGELFETSKFCPHCGTPVLEMSFRQDEKPTAYDTENASDDVEGLPEVNTGILTSEEQAAVLEMSAENILEDIPKIRKLDIEPASNIISENAPKKVNEPAKEEINKEKASKPSEEKIKDNAPEPQPQTENIPAEPKQKGNGGISAVIVILVVAAIGGAVFFFRQNDVPVNNVIEATETITELSEMTDSETISEISETEASAETAATETELASETILSSEVTAETELSAEEAVSENSYEAVLSEAPAAAELHTAEELSQGIIIEPEHQTAMGTDSSVEISLSDEGISTSILSSGALFLAEYTSTASATGNITPAAMTITIGDTVVDVSATSCSEGMVIFEYDVMTSAVTAAGFTAADIDKIGIISTGIPIDVFRITILQE